MKIAKLTIHNFLKLKDVEMNPSKTNIIVGKNKQGKTSIIKAIRAAFTGDADSDSIRIGEGKAEITLELDELTINRSITEKGNYLKISNKEGLVMPAPQKYLDGILGTFSFNPIEFFDKKAAERKKYLLNAIKLTINQEELSTYTGELLSGIDFDKHALEVVEDVRKFYYDKRSIANAEATKKEKALQELTSQIPEGFDITKVNPEYIEKLRAAIQHDKEERIRAENHADKVVALQKREVELKKELEEVQAQIAQAITVTFDVTDDMSMGAAEESLRNLEAQREIAFTVKRADEVRAELTTAIEEAGKLDTIVKKLTKDVPEDLIKKAKLPVEGLSISGDDILIGGVNIDNLSSSEQLKFGLQVVRALNGDFKVICVDGIESLDQESFEFFLKEVEGDDYQYFVSRVDGTLAEKNGHNIVEVEDGAIK